MPLRKSTPNYKKADADERLRRYHAREAGKKKFGEAAVKGKQIHHKDGNNNNNAPSNLELIDPKKHGSMHGAGNGKRGKSNPNGPGGRSKSTKGKKK
jgi:5-methylcytosine-specific restriction endonuclease McrA